MAGLKKRLRTRLAALIACGLAAAVVGAAPAQASVPPTNCGSLEVEGKKFQVKGHKVDCEFATRWSKHFLKRGHRPDGWTCVRYTAEESSIAFNCRKGGRDYYAIRK